MLITFFVNPVFILYSEKRSNSEICCCESTRKSLQHSLQNKSNYDALTVSKKKTAVFMFTDF